MADMKKAGQIAILGALSIVPVSGGFATYGSLRDRGNSVGASSILAGLATTVLGIGAALAANFIVNKAEDGATGALDIQRKIGLLDVQRNLGLLDVQRNLGALNIQRRPQKSVRGCIGCWN